MDGGVRQNTPIAPALRLGATHVFAVGLSREVRGIGRGRRAQRQRAPGAALLLGQVAERLPARSHRRRLRPAQPRQPHDPDGAAYGDDFLDEINATRSAAAPRITNTCSRSSCARARTSAASRPSTYEKAASRASRSSPSASSRSSISASAPRPISRPIFSSTAILPQLIELGRADAQARKHELLSFFEEPARETPSWSRWRSPAPARKRARRRRRRRERGGGRERSARRPRAAKIDLAEIAVPPGNPISTWPGRSRKEPRSTTTPPSPSAGASDGLVSRRPTSTVTERTSSPASTCPSR